MELRLSSCGSPISNKGTEVLHYAGPTFWIRTLPIFGSQTRNLSTIRR